MLTELIGLAQAYWPMLAGAFLLLVLVALTYVVVALSKEGPDYTYERDDSAVPHSTPEEDAFRASEVPWYVSE